jgi:hypothetical protein
MLQLGGMSHPKLEEGVLGDSTDRYDQVALSV